MHHPTPGSNCSVAADAVMLTDTISCGGSPTTLFALTVNDTLPVIKTLMVVGRRLSADFPTP